MEKVKVKIVTDSSSYLDPEIVSKYDIRVLPLRIGFGADFYREGVEITNDEFYRRMATFKKLPTTSQPPFGEFTQVYGDLSQSGHPVLSVHISSKLSGTVNSALSARKEYPQAEIEVVDTLSMPLRFFIIPAAEAAEQGRSLAEVKAIVERIVEITSIVAMLDTLEYLWKGGRIGRAKALLGTMLSVKPIVTLNMGEVDALANVRSRNKAMEYMLNFIERRVGSEYPLSVGVIHTNAHEEAVILKEKVGARFNCPELEIIEFGPVLTTYLGPGTLAMGFHVME